MKTIGILIVIVGVIALVYGGIDYYNHDDTLLKIGSAEIEASDGRDLPMPAILGAIVLLGGIALVMAGNRRGLHT